MLDHFVGREWLVGEVDAFLRDKDRGYFVLQAEAGMGKTTFLAWLVNTRGYIQHFCELAPGLEGVKTGLRSLTAQLTVACRLSGGGLKACCRDAAERQDYLYRMLCLAAESRKPGDKIVLVIDALDSAGTPHDQNTLALPRVCPEGYSSSSRQRPTSVKLQVDDATTPRAVVRLSARQADNQDDTRRFLEAATRWPGIAQALQESGFASRRLVEVLLQKSGGVWIYLHFVIHEIERGDRTLEQLDGLPDGLTRYYGDYWMRQRDKAERKWDELYLPLLATLAAAPEAVPIQSLMEWACVSSTPVQEVRRLLGVQWRAFISATQRDGQDIYHFYHASLREFFTGLTESNVPVTDELDSLTDEQEFVAEVRQATAEARNGSLQRSAVSSRLAPLRQRDVMPRCN